MAVQSGIKLEGVDDLRKMLENIAPRDARNIMRATIHGVASELAKDAKRNAPKDTGTLRKAIKAKRRRPRNPDKPFSDVMVEHGRDAKHDAFYWRFIEYGTQDQPERPFIRPAIDSLRPQVPTILREQFGKKLEASLKRKAKKADKVAARAAVSRATK